MMKDLLNTYEGEEKSVATTQREYLSETKDNQIIRGFEAAYEGKSRFDSGFKIDSEFHKLFQSGWTAFKQFEEFGKIPDRWDDDLIEKSPPCVNHSI